MRLLKHLLHLFQFTQRLLAWLSILSLLSLLSLLSHLLHGLAQSLKRLRRSLLSGSSLLQCLFLRLIEIAGILDGLLHRLRISCQFRIETCILQGLLHGSLLLGEPVQLIGDVLQLVLDRRRLLRIEFSRLQTIGKTFEGLVGRLEVALRQALGQGFSVFVSLIGDLQVRQRIPQCRVHLRLVTIEDLVQPILQTGDLANRFATNLFRGFLGFLVVRDLLILDHLIDRAFHFRRKHLVLFDHGDEVFDFFIRLLVRLGKHDSVLRRRWREQVSLRHQSPDADREEKQQRRHPPTGRRLRLKCGSYGSADSRSSRHRRGIGDRGDRERVVAAIDLNRRAESITKAEPFVDGDRHGHRISSRTEASKNSGDKHGRRDDRSGNPPGEYQRGHRLGHQNPEQEHGQPENRTVGEGLQKTGQHEPSGGESNEVLDLDHEEFLRAGNGRGDDLTCPPIRIAPCSSAQSDRSHLQVPEPAEDAKQFGPISKPGDRDIGTKKPLIIRSSSWSPEMPISCRRTPSAIVAILALVALSTPGQAQAPETDLARENERLSAQVRDLEATLKAALARIAELEKSLAAAGSSGTTPGTTAAPRSIAASNLSPAGLTTAIRADFKAEFEASGLPVLTDTSTEEDRIRYERWLKKWVAARNRQFRERVSWPVAIKGAEAVSTNETLVNFQPWDIKDATAVGKTFELVIPTRSYARATRRRNANMDDDIARLDGVFVPRIRFNSARMEPGPFDNPPYLGPMAELFWSFDFKALSAQITDADATPADASGTKP